MPCGGAASARQQLMNVAGAHEEVRLLIIFQELALVERAAAGEVAVLADWAVAQTILGHRDAPYHLEADLSGE